MVKESLEVAVEAGTQQWTRAQVLGERTHDFHCKAGCGPKAPPQSTMVVPGGWRFTWGCGYAVGVTNDPEGLEAAEGYWRQT